MLECMIKVQHSLFSLQEVWTPLEHYTLHMLLCAHDTAKLCAHDSGEHVPALSRHVSWIHVHSQHMPG